jgi:hypothetical protein
MHSLALVLVDGDLEDEKHLQDEVELAIKPFNYENNMSGWWDWSRIGGRFDGCLYGLEPLDIPFLKEGKYLTKESSDIHYSKAVETIERNACKVRDLPEKVVCFTIVVDGEATSRPDLVVDYYKTLNLERDTPDEFDKFVIETLLVNRDKVAVAVDYHS